ncbi:restriction endonuclease subunit S [Thermoflavimicrobium dichotomicum]|uniref:Type I restriction enzyme, S subunit n=1 Tax=Thermoflavimicrobium dichotomicum TaxID=46223 RepID=A0A1I3TLC0_9BACL|nr:restriction endonuclease subunit S [Thermoflavimicrobium dichotomicum]SFJ71352.1 type I restriction enzyme, S subunit [Thermoflavimicrobium dichotomicum]
MSFEEWEKTTADDFCFKVTDGTHDSPKKVEGGKYLVTSRHLKGYELDFQNAYLISNEDFAKINERSKVEQWDILFSMIGTVGEVYLERNPEINYAIKNVGLFKFNGDELKAKWFYYFLKSNLAQEYIYSNLRGSTQQYLTLGALRKFPVLYPKKQQEMKKIINILDSIDGKIYLNNQINKDLEEMAQAIFKSWFVDFEPFQDGEFVESELGMIPKGWEVIQFKDIATISTKSVKPQEFPEELFEHYSIPSFDSKRFPSMEKGCEIKSNKYVVTSDTILVSKLNPSTKRVWKPLCLTNNAVSSTEFINYLAKDKEFTYFVFSLVNSDAFNEFLQQHATGSTNSRQRVSPKQTLEFKLPFPRNLDIVREFIKIVQPIYEKISLNLIESNNLKTLRDTLLPKLMSGEIRVPLSEEGSSEDDELLRV